MRTSEYQCHLEQNFAHYTREITGRCIYTLNFMKIQLIVLKRQKSYFKLRILKLEKN